MNRPRPPASLVELSDLSDFGTCLMPAPEVWEWLQAEILADSGSIHNEDHAHLHGHYRQEGRLPGESGVRRTVG